MSSRSNRRSNRRSNSIQPQNENLEENQIQLITSRFTRDYQTLPLSGLKSKEWNHFGILSSEEYDVPINFRDKRVCNECLSQNMFLSQVSYYETTTGLTNIKNHLKFKHKIEYENERVRMATSSLNFALVTKCCLDYSSFNSIEKVGFVQLMKRIRPDLKIPTGNHLAQNVLPNVYDQFKNFVKNYIRENFKYGCITCDIWVDNFYDKSYIGFDLFFLNNELKLTHILLDVDEIMPPHNRSNILQQTRMVLQEYGINESKVSFTTDSGANILAAMRDGNLNNSSCIAHSIHNLIMKDCLKNQNPEMPANGKF